MKAPHRGTRPDFVPAPRTDGTLSFPNTSSASRPNRRYSIRIGALATDHPLGLPASKGNPSQPQTWDPSWAAAFNQLKVDGEVYRENLRELLVLIGHRSADEGRVLAIANKVSTCTSFSAYEVFDFISKFEADLRAETRKAFNASAGQQGGKVPSQELEELVRQMGYTPIPHSVREVLREAANELGEHIGDGVMLPVFERLIGLLEQREGFCKSDLDILEGAFQQFDKNKNGMIDRRELQPLLESLDFCLDENIVKSLVAHQLQGGDRQLTWKDFLCISRKRVQLEFQRCQELFNKCGGDEEGGVLEPGELMRMVSRLGVSLLPETLADLTDECGVDGDSIDFAGFWTMLQVLKAREGFTMQEASQIHEVFNRFDSTNRGEMPLKRVLAALSWLGYQSGPGVIGKANKQVVIPPTGSGYMTEAQFMKLARKHREAQLQAIRKVYRTFAEDRGAGRLQMQNLQAAVTRLNRLFVNDFHEWIKTYRPAARIARKHISFDYEEFRIIVLYCCEKMMTRIHRNCGYSEVQLTKLRIEFVKYTKDGCSTEVDVVGLMKLIRALFPQAQTSPTVRNRLKIALEQNSSRNTGLDWHHFLCVMQTYNDLAEIHAEQCVEAGIAQLRVPEDCIDRAQELLMKLISEAEVTLTSKETQFLVQGIAPRLTEAEAVEALERLQEADAVGTEGEFNKVTQLQQIILQGDLAKRRPSSRQHDRGMMASR